MAQIDGQRWRINSSESALDDLPVAESVYDDQEFESSIKIQSRVFKKKTGKAKKLIFIFVILCFLGFSVYLFSFKNKKGNSRSQLSQPQEPQKITFKVQKPNNQIRDKSAKQQQLRHSQPLVSKIQQQIAFSIKIKKSQPQNLTQITSKEQKPNKQIINKIAKQSQISSSQPLVVKIQKQITVINKIQKESSNASVKIMSQEDRYNLAMKDFNPWDLSTETKQILLKKYSTMPRVNSSQTKYMPIVQDYDEQIKPVLQQIQKHNQVIDYESLTMSEQQHNNYTNSFQKKLKIRLDSRKQYLNNQKGLLADPNGVYSFVSKLKRYQWHDAFQYHMLVGVDLDKNEQLKAIAEKQKKHFEEKYETNKYEKELTMCVVCPGYNNVDLDRYMWTVESIMQQNYTNFRLVMIDDSSTDGTGDKLAKHLKWRGVSKDKYILIKNKKNYKPLGNIVYGTYKYCKFGQIQYVVDGDDELIGRQVFKVMNAVYQKQKMLTVYSSHMLATGNSISPRHILGISKDYWQKDIDTNNFRKTSNRGYHHLRTMMSDTILLMRPQTFKDWQGRFYEVIGDNGCYYPAMEMSCKKVKYLPEIFYIYYYNTGINEDFVTRSKKEEYNRVLNHINNQKPYRCLARQFLDISYSTEQKRFVTQVKNEENNLLGISGASGP